MNISLGRRIYRQYGIYILFVALFVILSIFGDNFLSISNITNIMRQVSVYAILGFGMTFVMISGRIDLSVGSILALSGCVSAVVIQKGQAAGLSNWICVWLAVVSSLLVGCLCGLINGLCIAKLKVPFFITTAGMMYAASGIALVITKENPIALPDEYQLFGGKTIGIIPSQFIIAVGFFILCFIILNHTKMGRYTYAIGSNERTAKLSGINVDKYVILIFLLNGLCAALAGIIVASRGRLGSPLVGSGYEIYAVAAAAIGGTSLAGGEGTLQKTVVGALILTIIGIGLNILGISQSNQKIIIGVIMIVVVALDMWDRRRQD